MTETGSRVLTKLTEKDKQLLVGVCQGQTNRDIAKAVGSAEETIKSRMQQVFRKTGQSNRVGLVIFAFHHGMVECPCGRKEKP